MKEIPFLPISPTYIERFIEVRDKKAEPTKSDLICIHELISQRYQVFEFLISKREIEIISDTPLSAFKDQLRSCYDSSTNALLQLKLDIKNNIPQPLRGTCPLCKTTIPSTFDHYLPISFFPEFSIHPLNLIPCCSTCNTTKNNN